VNSGTRAPAPNSGLLNSLVKYWSGLKDLDEQGPVGVYLGWENPVGGKIEGEGNERRSRLLGAEGRLGARRHEAVREGRGTNAGVLTDATHRRKP
jgi:hypothetical protein